MKYRPFGKHPFNCSEIGFGAWAIGGSWGEQQDDTSLAALHTALDAGCNFIDRRKIRATRFCRHQDAAYLWHLAARALLRGRRALPRNLSAPKRRRTPCKPWRAQARPPATPHLDARVEPQPDAVQDPPPAPARGPHRAHRSLHARARPKQRHRPHARRLDRFRAAHLQSF